MPATATNSITQTEIVDAAHFFSQSGINLNKNELENLISCFDRDGNGLIDYNEIVSIIGTTSTQEELSKKVNLLSLFYHLDADMSGEISIIEYKNVLTNMKHNRKNFCQQHNVDEEFIRCVDNINDQDIQLLFSSIDSGIACFLCLLYT